MKRYILTISIVLSHFVLSFAQKQAALWYVASQESAALNLYEGKAEDAKELQFVNPTNSILTMDKINSYPSVQFESDGAYYKLITDGLLYVSQITTMIVYHPKYELASNGLWSLMNGKNRCNYLTSEEIANKNIKIVHGLENRLRGPVVNVSVHTFDKKGIKIKTEDTLSIAYADGKYFNGKIAEFITLKGKIQEKEKCQWQTYLCLKYGVTMLKDNYLNSNGDSLWIYKENINYSKGIGGFGRDDAFSFNQQQSQIWNDSVCIGINNVYSSQDLHNSVLEDREFLLWGHNDGDISTDNWQYHTDTATYKLWNRRWLAKSAFLQKNNYNTTVRASVPEDKNVNLLRLFINRRAEFEPHLISTEIYMPDSITGNNVWFNNINWDTDKSGFDYFTFGYVCIEDKDLVQISNRENSDENNDSNTADGNTSYIIYPNPSKGEYELRISLKDKSPVVITVKDVLGRQLEKKTLNGDKNYLIKDRITSLGLYYFEIKSTYGQEVLSLIVNP